MTQLLPVAITALNHILFVFAFISISSCYDMPFLFTILSFPLSLFFIVILFIFIVVYFLFG